MKKKELINLIKLKAKEIEIKDFSSNLIERAKNLPEPILQKKKNPFFIKKPAFAMSFVTFAAVIIFTLMLSPGQKSFAMIDDIDLVFTNSSITSISLLSASLDTELNNESYQLSSVAINHNYQADEHLDQMLHYLGATEAILNDVELIKAKNINGYQFYIEFRVKDLLNEETKLQIYYNQTEVKKNSEYSYEGYIEIDDQTFDFQANIVLGKTNLFEFKIDHDSTESIIIRYRENQNESIYQIERYKQNISTQKVEMRQTTINEEKQIMINFIEGSTKGTYAFSKQVINNQPSIRVNYLIRGQNNESGEIIITPSSSSEVHITITPRGQAPIVIERGRPPKTIIPGRGNPFLTQI